MSRTPAIAPLRTATVAPASSHERLLHWLRKAGYELLEGGQRPQVAIVDMTAEGGRDALLALRQTPASANLAVLCIVGDAHDDAAEALQSGSDGFVAVGSMEREFDLRLEAVRKLAGARAENARKEQDLAALLDLTAEYASALDVSGLLHQVTRRLADELDIDRCALVLVDEERAQGFIVAASDDRAVRDVRIELSRYPEIREALRTSRPVVVDDASSHPLFDEVKEAVAKRGISALAAIPLSVREKTLGVLLLRASEGTRTFSAREVNFAWTVAHATGIALRNARMLEGLRGQAEKAEAQVAELARYQEFFRHVSDAIVILDADGCVIAQNPAAAEILGFDIEQLRGKPFVGYAARSSEEQLQELLTLARRGQVVRGVDLEMRTRDDRTVVLAAGASCIQGGGSILLSFRDVTHSRSMQRERLKTKEFLETLVDSSVDAIVAADLRGNVIVFNKSAEKILGYGHSEVIGGALNVARLYPEGVARSIMKMIRSEDHGGHGRLLPTRTELLTRTGELVPVMMSAALIREGEHAVASVGIFSDLRERAKLEARLSRAQEKLQQAERQAVIVELAGTAAHELNQPLTSVMGYAELLKRRMKEEDPGFKAVDIIYREAERMAEIVRKIGKITRYETKAYVGDRRIFDLDRATGGDE